jgi:hypothetical protein
MRSFDLFSKKKQQTNLFFEKKGEKKRCGTAAITEDLSSAGKMNHDLEAVVISAHRPDTFVTVFIVLPSGVTSLVKLKVKLADTILSVKARPATQHSVFVIAFHDY